VHPGRPPPPLPATDPTWPCYPRLPLQGKASLRLSESWMGGALHVPPEHVLHRLCTDGTWTACPPVKYQFTSVHTGTPSPVRSRYAPIVFLPISIPHAKSRGTHPDVLADQSPGRSRRAREPNCCI
jgi:hypothetical protein